MPIKYRIKVKPPTQQQQLSKTKLKQKELLAQGRRWICFTVPIDTWNKFLSLACQKEKPSVVLTLMIEKEVKNLAQEKI